MNNEKNIENKDKVFEKIVKRYSKKTRVLDKYKVVNYNEKTRYFEYTDTYMIFMLKDNSINYEKKTYTDYFNTRSFYIEKENCKYKKFNINDFEVFTEDNKAFIDLKHNCYFELSRVNDILSVLGDKVFYSIDINNRVIFKNSNEDFVILCGIRKVE